MFSRAGLQLRVESSRIGRVAISLFVIAVVSLMVIVTLPQTVAPPKRVTDAANDALGTVGLYQPWSLFTPPRNEILELEARVAFADGSSTMWRPPKGDPFVGAYADYHWQKYVEHAIFRGNPDGWPRLWEPLARYIARDVDRPDRHPTKVTLVARRTRNWPLEANEPLRSSTTVNEYYTLDLTATKADR